MSGRTFYRGRLVALAGLAIGETVAMGAAIAELTVRGGLGVGGWTDLAARLPLAIGAYALAGAAAGLVASQIWAIGGRRAGELRPGLGALTAVFAAAAGLALRRFAGLPVGARSIALAAVALGALVAVFGLAVGTGRLARALTRRALVAPIAAVAIAAVAWTAPHLVLGEPLLGVAIRWRLAAGLLGAACGLLTLLGFVAWHGTSGGREPRLGRWAAAGAGALLLPLVLAAVPPRHGSASPEAPNVVLIVIDTLRADRLSTYGYERPTSPHIDRLGASGAVFEQAATPASFTQPAMASLFTGRYPFEHGLRFHPGELRPAEQALAEILRARGYATGAVVSNPVLASSFGFDQGFDQFDSVGELRFGGTRDWRLSRSAEELTLFRMLRGLRRDDRSGDTAAAAIQWLRRHRDRPFFLWVHFVDPHFPYDPPAPYDRAFNPDLTDAYRKVVRAYVGGEIGKGQLAVRERLPELVLAEGSDQYDGEIAYTDASIGVLLDAVVRLGLTERTLFVVTADHGESLGEHGVNFAHLFTVYEQVMRVPLIMAGWPGIPSGTRVLDQVSLIDIAPTILELLEIPAPEGMRGRSLAPLLGVGGKAPMASAPAYGENAPLLPGHPTSEDLINLFENIYVPGIEGKWRMIRSAPWKLIHIPGRPEGEDLLFRLDQDPEEQVDRSAEEPEVLARLKEHLAAILAADSGSTDGEQSIDPETEEMLRSLGYIN